MLRVVGVLFFIFCSLEAADVNAVIRSMPPKDKEKIECLFTFLVQRDTLGYVLFGGTKPVCFTSIPLTHKEYVMPYKSSNPIRFQKDLKESWDVWKRYEHRFKHPNILICEEYESINNGMYLQLFIIDKKKLSRLLEEYQADFAEVLGKGFSPVQFVTRLERKKRLRPLIQRDEKLLGILLGFGRESSAAFRDLKLNGEIDTSQEFVGKRPQGCPIIPVSFRGNPNSEEVRTLLDRYSKDIKEIEKVYEQDDFLNSALQALCSS